MASKSAANQDGEGIEFWVHVRPGGRREGIDGEYDGVLAVRVTKPPEDGKANRAVIKVLAAHFEVPPRSVTITSGATARRKRIRISGDPPILSGVLATLLQT